MKIFLTGADGFIGSHLAEKLVNLNYQTKVLVMYNSFNSWGKQFFMIKINYT